MRAFAPGMLLRGGAGLIKPIEIPSRPCNFSQKSTMSDLDEVRPIGGQFHHSGDGAAFLLPFSEEVTNSRHVRMKKGNPKPFPSRCLFKGERLEPPPFSSLAHVTMLRSRVSGHTSSPRSSQSTGPAANTGCLVQLPSRTHRCTLQCRAGSRRKPTVMRGTGQFFVGGNWKCNGAYGRSSGGSLTSRPAAVMDTVIGGLGAPASWSLQHRSWVTLHIFCMLHDLEGASGSAGPWPRVCESISRTCALCVSAAET